MGLLSPTTSKAGLLNKQPVESPVPKIGVSPVANSTPQTSFNTSTPVVPVFSTQPQAPVSTTPTVPKLSGATTISQGKVSVKDKLLSKLPTGDTKKGFIGDIIRGVVNAPETIAREAGFLDEEKTVKLDRLAQSLINAGKDPQTAYEIAGLDLQKSSLDFNQQKNAREKYDKLGVTPQDEEVLKGARSVNGFMTGLTISNFFPIGGVIEQKIGKSLVKIAESQDKKVIAKELVDNFGVPKEKVTSLADSLVGVSTPEEVSTIIKDAFKTPKAGLLNKSVTETTDPELQKAFRNLKGLSADDIMAKHSDIQLKKDIPVTEIDGSKSVIKEGESLSPYELKGNKILLQDGETYVVSKNQYANIKGQSLVDEAKPFAPELAGTEESVKGGAPLKTFDDIKWTGNSERLVGTMADRKFGITKEQDGYYVFEQDGILGKQVKNYTQAVEELNRYLGKESPKTRYSSYTLPGGENYREVLIKAPTRETSPYIMFRKPANGDTGEIVKTFKNYEEASTYYNSLSSEKRLAHYIAPEKEVPEFKSSHWEDPNVISHLRINDRTYNGKKVTFMEELQSDWAREGRDKGFLKDINKEKMKVEKVPYSQSQDGARVTIDGVPFVDDFEWRKGKTIEEVKDDAIAISKIDHKNRGVPNNPLLKNWQEVSIKRALKDAVDNGSDYFAWINGEQTSARYNLAKQLEYIKWKKEADGLRQVTLREAKGGNPMSMFIDETGTVTSSDLPGAIDKKIDEVFGKGLADKILEKETGNLSGEGLKMGGEWADNLYNKQVKSIVEDLTGGKVEVIDLGLPVDKNQKFFKIKIDGVSRELNNLAFISPGDEVTVGRIGEGVDEYVVTDILGNGKFKAIPKKSYDDIKTSDFTGHQFDDLEKYRNDYIKESSDNKTFDISKKTTQQQAIRLTPEIKAKILGQAPAIKKPSGISPVEKIKEATKPTAETSPLDTSTSERDLIQEAKKYNNVDEFMKEQGEITYRGGKLREAGGGEQDFGQGFYFADNPSTAKGYGKIDEYVVSIKNPLKVANRYEMNDVWDEFIFSKPDEKTTLRDWLKSKGHDGIIVEDGGMGGEKGVGGFRVAFNESQIKTKSQLTDIWKKANTTNIRTPEELKANKEKLAKKLQETVVTPRPVKRPRTQAEQDELEVLKATKDQMDSMDFKRLQKYESKRGEFKGQLNINTGTGKFSKQYDTTLREVFNDTNNQFDSGELIEKYEKLKAGYKKVTDRIKQLESTTSDLKISTPKLETAPEKGASAITQGEAYRLRVTKQLQKEVSSLPDIVKREQTSVKGKVNALDYLRTPDRVLEKIGFAREARAVRKSYEAYVKELPKNIEKITEWSKQVPKESNERIFKYLDGQEIDLNKKEMKVAKEIQAWLKDWAVRLKLPEDKQISKYITHIFDRELVQKEFDEDLAKIITDKLPGSVYDPFLEKRLGKLGYKQDTWQALDAYVKRATRKANMDDALEMLKDKAGHSLEFAKIEASQFKYIQRYVNNINMRPAEIDNLIDNTLKNMFGYKYGNRPVTYLTKLLRQMTYRGMLGLNPASALRNLSQGINTYATLGEKYTALGYLKLFYPDSAKELKEAGVLMDSFIQDRSLSATKKAIEKIDKGLWAMFQGAEYVNRGSAYFGAKAKGLAEGMTEEQAVEYAKKIVRKTQFAFGSIDTPVALQNDIVKTLTQFQSYSVKQIEFLTEMAKDKNFVGLIRYAIGGLAFVYTIGRAFNMTPEQLIPSLRFGVPPSLKLPVEVTKAVLNTPDKYNQPRDAETKMKDIANSSVGLFPAGNQIKKTIEALQTIQKGGSFDKGGNLQYEAPQTTEGKIQMILFGKYSGENAQNYFNKSENTQKEIDQIRPFYDEVQRLKSEGKEQEALDVYNSLGEKGQAVYKKIKSQVQSEKTKEGKQEILPTFQKIRSLKAEGKEQEALDMYNGLSEDQKKYYQLLKKQLDKPVSENEPSAFKKNLLGALGVGTASAMENPETDEPQAIKTAIEKVYSEAEKIAPMIDKKYIRALVSQESSNGTDDKHRDLDAGKYGWLVGFTKGTLKNIEEKAKKSQKWANLKNSMAGFDTPEDAIKSALVFSEFLLRDHTKEQKTGTREWKNIKATNLYKLYNGNASPRGVKNFEKTFNELAVDSNTK